jgi:UTP--glucose-1-phosphate uridylyltransferase
LLKQIKSITTMANIHFVWQKELLGLGHAIMHARTFVGNEPFAVLLGDTLMEGNKAPVTHQLLEKFQKYQKSVVALERVPQELTYRYGVMDGYEVEKDFFRAKDFVEKPIPENAPSDLVIASRYIFTSEIFNYLELTKPGLGNEIQLTDAMRFMLKDQDIFGYKFDGIRYDIGNKLDFIKTNLIFGLKNQEIGKELENWLRKYQL